jgi:transposase
VLTRGVKLIYLPLYYPDYNPIEECFSYMKSMLRRYDMQFRAILETKQEEPIVEFLLETLATVTLSHARGWFHHANYI